MREEAGENPVYELFFLVLVLVAVVVMVVGQHVYLSET